MPNLELPQIQILYGPPAVEQELPKMSLIASTLLGIVAIIIGIGVVIKKKIKRKKENKDVEK